MLIPANFSHLKVSLSSVLHYCYLVVFYFGRPVDRKRARQAQIKKREDLSDVDDDDEDSPPPTRKGIPPATPSAGGIKKKRKRGKVCR